MYAPSPQLSARHPTYIQKSFSSICQRPAPSLPKHSGCSSSVVARAACSTMPCSSTHAAAAAAPSRARQGLPQLVRQQSRQQQHPGGRSAPTHVCRVLTESADMALGTTAPDFELLDPKTGRQVSLASISAGAKATLVMFICNHCPFVVLLKGAIAKLASEYQAKGVAVVAISSNSAATHPQDGPDKMADDAKQHGYTFPYLYDESQSIAKAYKAACTPEFYVFDADLKLTYHGQFDDSRPNSNKLVTGSDLRTALDGALSGNALPAGFKAKPSIGCNIKWQPGSEPAYYGTQIVQK